MVFRNIRNMTIQNMASLIMANMNTLIMKGYLLAGVMMAANMFVVNEVKASDLSQEITNGEKKLDSNIDVNKNLNKKKKNIKLNSSATQAVTLATLLGKKDVINFVGTFAVSCLNNYFELWDYKSGEYVEFGCWGWRSGRFIKDIFQFDINLNLIRGLCWWVPLQHFYYDRSTEVGKNEISKGHLIFSIVTGFISAPLTVHISKFNFSISISFDSILYWVVEMAINRWGKNKKAEENQINEKKEELKNIIINNKI